MFHDQGPITDAVSRKLEVGGSCRGITTTRAAPGDRRSGDDVELGADIGNLRVECGPDRQMRGT